MLLDTVKNDRISTRVNKAVKQAAARKFASHGLTISDVINIVLTNAANYGIPDYLEVPHQQAVKDIENSFCHLKRVRSGDKSIASASSYRDAMKMLTK